MGSAWKQEIEILGCSAIKNLLDRKELCILIFPHSFESLHLEEIHQVLDQSKITYEKAFELEDVLGTKNGEVSIVYVKGILCELYPISMLPL